MEPKTKIVLLVFMALAFHDLDAQFGRKTLNFVDEFYETVSGESAKISPELVSTDVVRFTFGKCQFKPLPTRSLNFGRQSGPKSSRAKENIIVKLYRSNFILRFRISKNMNLMISYI